MKNSSYRIFLTATLSASILLTGCHSRQAKPISENDVATGWADLTLYITKNTPANSPTYASRCLGYIGLTMYESIVPGYADYNSMGNQLNGLATLPLPENNKAYNWILSLNAGQALILKKLYNQTSDANKFKIDSLEAAINEYFARDLSPDVVNNSVAYGRRVAEQIFAWSVNDGGHRGYLHNFDKKLITPTHPGCWEPPLYGQAISHLPLHPYWGKNRNFVTSNSLIPVPELHKFDTTSASSYASQFKEVYEKSSHLSQTEKEIALWWGDDPGETFTPPGHSYYLGTLVLRKKNCKLIECAETYARIGLAVADSFINCWKWKYHYFSERPSSYISKQIDNRWESFWPDPPFPAFPSGHATQAAAVATVLADQFGENFEFTDDAHVGRPLDEIRNVEFKARTFTSFWQVAEETAMSRFYGGIHTPHDNNVGLREGRKMGENVNNLHWRKDAVFAKIKQ